jgi:nitrate/nitrite-specific signal transduction histidine kinase
MGNKIIGSGFSGQGLLSGIVSIAGLGKLYDPLGDKKSQLASMTQDFYMNQIENSYELAKLQGNVNEKLFNFTKGINNQIHKELQSLQEKTSESVQEINLFMIFFAILIFVIIFYLIII